MNTPSVIGQWQLLQTANKRGQKWMNTGGSSRESCRAVHVCTPVEAVQKDRIMQCSQSVSILTSAPTFNIRSCPSSSLPAGDGGVWTTTSEYGEMLTTYTLFHSAVVEQYRAINLQWDTFQNLFD